MYYPRVRAKRQTPSFTTVGPAKTTAGEAKSLRSTAPQTMAVLHELWRQRSPDIGGFTGLE